MEDKMWIHKFFRSFKKLQQWEVNIQTTILHVFSATVKKRPLHVYSSIANIQGNYCWPWKNTLKLTKWKVQNIPVPRQDEDVRLEDWKYPEIHKASNLLGSALSILASLSWHIWMEWNRILIKHTLRPTKLIIKTLQRTSTLFLNVVSFKTFKQ